LIANAAISHPPTITGAAQERGNSRDDDRAQEYSRCVFSLTSKRHAVETRLMAAVRNDNDDLF
jgi:hypothetical protein